jgi:hypothetical protein
MGENSMPRRLMYMQREGSGIMGRPGTRWRDDLGKNARMLGIRNWRATAMNREECRKLLKEANCSADDDDDDDDRRFDFSETCRRSVGLTLPPVQWGVEVLSRG